MVEHKEIHTLNFYPKDLFNIVLDIESYPEFIPWCEAARVYNVKKDQFEADLIIGYSALNAKYTSKVKFSPPKNKQSHCIINVDLVKGPFNHLVNNWEFKWDSKLKQTVVHFYIRFEFDSKIFQTILNPIFEKAITKMITAFKKRAEESLIPIQP